MANCEICRMRDYETPATATTHGFNEDGEWRWELPVCAAHEGVQGVKPCETCEEHHNRIRPGVKHYSWNAVLCDECVVAMEKELRPSA